MCIFISCPVQEIAGDHSLGSGGNGLQAGGAKAVDGHARHSDRTAGTQGDLAGNVGTGRAFRRATAHDDVVHLAGLNACALDGVLDYVAAHGCAMGHVESALPGLGQWRACGRNDNC
jgi:hypothetical protein